MRMEGSIFHLTTQIVLLKSGAVQEEAADHSWWLLKCWFELWALWTQAAPSRGSPGYYTGHYYLYIPFYRQVAASLLFTEPPSFPLGELCCVYYIISYAYWTRIAFSLIVYVYYRSPVIYFNIMVLLRTQIVFWHPFVPFWGACDPQRRSKSASKYPNWFKIFGYIWGNILETEFEIIHLLVN